MRVVGAVEMAAAEAVRVEAAWAGDSSNFSLSIPCTRMQYMDSKSRNLVRCVFATNDVPLESRLADAAKEQES